MSEIEILQKAIEKAKDNGFDESKACKSIGYFALTYAVFKNRRRGSAFMPVSKNIVDSYSVIFSHPFAKAFWKNEENISIETFRYKGTEEFLHQSGNVPMWLWHLMFMVAQENPIDYLKKFL